MERSAVGAANARPAGGLSATLRLLAIAPAPGIVPGRRASSRRASACHGFLWQDGCQTIVCRVGPTFSRARRALWALAGANVVQQASESPGRVVTFGEAMIRLT